MLNSLSGTAGFHSSTFSSMTYLAPIENFIPFTLSLQYSQDLLKKLQNKTKNIAILSQADFKNRIHHISWSNLNNHHTPSPS